MLSLSAHTFSSPGELICLQRTITLTAFVVAVLRSRWVPCLGHILQNLYALLAFSCILTSYLQTFIQYSLKTRGKAVSLATATNWMFNTALAWAVPPGLANIAWKTYFIFGTFNFAACIHIFFMYPETVGRTLEEVEDIFRQGNVFTAWRIGKDVGKKTLAEVTEKAKALPVRPFFYDLLYYLHIVRSTGRERFYRQGIVMIFSYHLYYNYLS